MEFWQNNLLGQYFYLVSEWFWIDGISQTQLGMMQTTNILLQYLPRESGEH